MQKKIIVILFIILGGVTWAGEKEDLASLVNVKQNEIKGLGEYIRDLQGTIRVISERQNSISVQISAIQERLREIIAFEKKAEAEAKKKAEAEAQKGVIEK